jgi:uncharacterized protein YyaL (SSP411 family)
MPNHLTGQTSPYLLQHANNPVDWYPWCEESLSRAKEEDKAIFLSIGYSACHWCHVMEEESFEDPQIAELMNRHFINIKVDREERPDIDSIYMTAIQSMRGQGGWPLSIFLTPEGKPFYGGTYFPPEDKHGMPSFSKVLSAVADAYENRRHDINESAEQISAMLKKHMESSLNQDPLDIDITSKAYGLIEEHFDESNGGFGTYPKFPQPMVLEFLLRHYDSDKSNHTKSLHMVNVTLDHMAKGGIYDQIGGGFHRYSTDKSWLIPHFEKMLYDNALISNLYIHAYQVTGKNEYKIIATETLDYVIREMADKNGGFYSAQDADSEGFEGKYFIWTSDELQNLLNKEQYDVIRRYFSIEEDGYFEGANVLNRSNDSSALAKELHVGEEYLSDIIEQSKEILMSARYDRVAPQTDTKILTSWNALMIQSFVSAAAVFDREDYLQIAKTNASFILNELRVEGRLMRTYRNGHAKINGFLEDYASLIGSLLCLYEYTLDPIWYNESKALTDDMIYLFWDNGEKLFYDTAIDHEQLVVRPRNITDNAIPCGASMATNVLLKLGILCGQQNYSDIATSALESVQLFMAQVPIGFGHWLECLDFYLSSPKEIAIVGNTNDINGQTFMRTIFSKYMPNKVIAGYNPNDEQSFINIPLLEDKDQIGQQTTVHICHNYFCLMPITTTEELEAQLESKDPGGLKTLF